MRPGWWLVLVVFGSGLGCSDEPSAPRPAGQPDAQDVQSTGTGGAGGAATDSATEAAAGSAGAIAPDASPDSMPDASIDTHTAPDASPDISDVAAPDVLSDATTPDGGDAAPEVRVDSAVPDINDAGPDAYIDARAPDGGDATPDSSVATDGSLPPMCNYAIEPVPGVTGPYPLCGTTVKSPNGTYLFSELRLRQPFSNPTPIEPFTGGTMTVRNGASVNTYQGQSWQSPMGDEIRFQGPGGTDIVFTNGVQEISVTTTEQSGKIGCLPQPCTWIVTP